MTKRQKEKKCEDRMRRIENIILQIKIENKVNIRTVSMRRRNVERKTQKVKNIEKEQSKIQTKRNEKKRKDI